LRAKAEGYPQGETLRGEAYAKEPEGPRYAMPFVEGWATSYLPTMNSTQYLTNEEITELEGLLEAWVAALPTDWQVGWSPGGG
jgi:hypothetical protein